MPNFKATQPHFIVLAREITLRKQNESRMIEDRNRYQSLVENSPVCIYETDLTGNFISMNRKGLSMMGVFHEREILDRPYIDVVGSDDMDRVQSLFEAACNGESAHFEFSGNGLRKRTYKSCFVPLRSST